MASAQQPAAPLAGVTVVALEQAVSAPMCTRALADFGARVIKVENPAGGDFARHYDDVVNGPGGLAAHFVWANRNKESVALDLKAPEGIDILHRLLDRADVLVSNLAPGSTARLGISPDQLRDRHPEVIAVEIDGYGAGGPLSHKRAYDLLAQSESGSCAVTGYPGKPAKPGPPIADISTGLYSALSIMALLYSRDDRPRARCGQRQPVRHHDGSDGLPADLHPALRGRPAAAGHEFAGGGALWGIPHRRRPDGGAGHHQRPEWQRLAREIIERPDLADDPRFATNSDRVANRAVLDEAISWCGRHDLVEVQKVADAAGIGNARTTCPARCSSIRS
jgi:crotonobetainyl-CoA:carnitine CoA-transferase CaiB-like acyl-CoA transferase